MCYDQASPSPRQDVRDCLREPRSVVACSSVDPSLLGLLPLLTCVSIFQPCTCLTPVAKWCADQHFEVNGRICAVVLA
jgi:hypothetical protein